MSIGNVIQQDSLVYVYDEKGRQTAAFDVGPKGRLVGHTSTTVSVRRGAFTYTYDEEGYRKGKIVAADAASG
ncbi:conserved protein of unknown function [Rhodovastum atsumiense]|uniref:Uncharacterized protein n=1 Tax=Rhodovastum atsumiense TaxID=504468 RepID=A0A5M6IW12_9PROT|nr:hypothetical protein [Rhodovastum atsumiense]KAA5612017.1 hypothetical protein F1189_11200 [Rhodovastum atsumiense]CAH2604123.1 conserved protein of unknown function [Rhodovastum atsumiense]